ncbi:hypothetical protein NEF87_002469 [Candidatus Lokiarchaeum ossiferum]|uniref:Uncharacterized protein n=1 Tax=Candidatus Lokiarchaeum ossiferum TaxID=2951803 RepID=A0ABY6HUP9_9ARCH|nr:hypothetical protein NEF87_002469 [Candidatus Lokiarchaeum sp. B-35]
MEGFKGANWVLCYITVQLYSETELLFFIGVVQFLSNQFSRGAFI